MDSIDGTGLPTQPQQQTPQAPRKWSEIELESSIYSLEPQDRIGLFDQWAKQAQDYQLKAGGFDNPENFQKFKIKEIQTRRRLLSPMGDDPDPAVVQQDYKAYIDMIGEEQKRQAAKKPDQKVYQEVLDGKRNAAFVGGQMIFNPKVTRDPALYRQALAETDAPSDIKVIYAGRREDEDKRASITRRDELASKIVTPQIAERVVSAVQEGTEILGVDVGAPQDAGIRKDVNGIWSVADPNYVDWDKGIVSGVMSKVLPGAAAQYKPMKELNEFQKKYGLSDDEMKADYMEALKRSAPTSVSRWVTNADSLEDYVPVLSSKVRVLDPDIKPRIFVPNADLAFDKEAYDAVVDSAKAPEEAKTLAKESRTQIAKSLALPTYNLLLNNRDDFMPYAEKVKSKDDMVDAVSKYYKDKKDQSWYEDLNEFVGQAGGGLDTGVRRFYNLRNVIPAMFGDVEAAENAAAIERDLSDENRVREMVSSRMGMPTAFKLTRDIAAIAPDLAAQFAISMLTGGVGTSVAAASIASRTGLKYAAARAALGAAMTGAKQPALRGLVAKIPGVAAGSVDNVATAAIDAAKQLTTKNPLKGGLGTQQLVSGATAGLASMSGTFSEVYSSLRDEGMPPEQALDKARNSAAVAAAITSAITYGFSAFGRGGAEDAATTQMRQSGQFTVRDLVSAGIPELLTTEGGRQAIKKTAVGFLRKPGDEALEEALDQFAGGLAQYVTNPSKEAQDKSMSEIIQESLYAGLLGGIVGGGIASLEQATLTAGGSTAPQIEAEMLGAGAVPPAAPPAPAPAAPTPSPATPAAPAPAVPAPTPPAPTPAPAPTAPASAATVVPPAPTVTTSGPPVTPAVTPSFAPPAPPLASPPPAPTFRQLAGTSVLVDNEAGSIKIDDDGTVLFDRGPNTPPIILSRNQDELVSSSEFNVRSAFPVELTPSAPTSVRDDGAIVTTSTGTKGAVSIVTDFVSEGETAEGNLFVTVRDRETGSEFELHGDDALVVAIARRNRQQDNDLDAAITAATPPQLLDFNRVLARLLAGKQNLLEVSNDESGQVFSQEKIDAAFEELVSLNTAIQNENLPADIRERLTQTIDNALNELASRRSQSQPGAAAASVGAETATGAPSRGGAAQTGNVSPAKPAGAETRVSAAVQNATVVAQNLAQNPDTSITAAALQQVANQTPAQPVAAPAPVTPAPTPAVPAVTETEAPSETTPVAPKGLQGSQFESSMPKGKERVTGQYQIIEADDLVTSSDPGFPQELQPRDRTRDASQQQITEIQINLDPERLAESLTVEIGAPIIDENGVVLSGNGRVSAIRKSYESGKRLYKDWISQNSERFGINSADVSGMKNPILVRKVENYGNMSKQEFTVQANQSPLLGMSKGEKTKADATILLSNPELFAKFLPNEDGNVLVATNREFVNDFVKETNSVDLLKSDGGWTPELGVRIKNAVLGTIIEGDVFVINNLIEDPAEYGLKNIAASLSVNAPNLARLRGTELSINQPIVQAVKDLIYIKSNGQKVDDFLNQEMLFRDPERSAISDIILKKFAETKSQKELNEFFASYIRVADEELKNIEQENLFFEQRTPEEILNEISKRTKQPAAEQQDLTFGKPKATSAKPAAGQRQAPEAPAPTPEVTPAKKAKAVPTAAPAATTAPAAEPKKARFDSKWVEGVVPIISSMLDSTSASEVITKAAGRKLSKEQEIDVVVEWVQILKENGEIALPVDFSGLTLEQAYMVEPALMNLGLLEKPVTPKPQAQATNPVSTKAAAEPIIVEAPVVEKKERRLAKDQMTVSVAPKTDIPDRVPASLKGKMYEIQIAGANAVIDSMEKNGAALNGDGTGVGKTRQIIAVAKYYADKGKVVFIISKNDALGKPFEGNGPYKLGGSMQKDSVDMGVDLTLFGHKQENAKPGNIYITNYDRIQIADVPDGAVVIFDEAHEMVNIYGDGPGEKPNKEWAVKLRPIIEKSSGVAYYTATPGDKPHQFAYLHKILGFPTANDYLTAMVDAGAEIKKSRFNKRGSKYSVPKGGLGRRLNSWVNSLMLNAGVEGRFIKREISYDGTSVQFQDIKGTSAENPWSKYYTDSIEQMNQWMSQGWRISNPDGVETFSAELTKIGSAIEILEKELKKNRKVVMFFSRIKEFDVNVSKSEYMMGEKNTIREVAFRLPSPVELVKDELKKRGITFTELHGKTPTKASEAQRQFQEGNINVMLASVESGGTGINLDDTKGTEPRSMIFMFAPYRGVSTVQALGRVWRSTTIQNDNNPTRFLFLTTTDIRADNIRAAVLSKKLQVMGAAIGGTAVSKMPLSRVEFTTEQLVGLEFDEDQIMSQFAEAENQKPLKPVNVIWKPTRPGSRYAYKADITEEIREWYNNGGLTRTGLDGKGLNVWLDKELLLSNEPFLPEAFATEQDFGTPLSPPVNKPAVSDDGSPDPRKTDDLSVSSLTRQAYTPGEARKIGVTRLAAELGITSGGMDAIGEVLGRIARTGRRRHKKIASDLINVLQGTGVQIKLVSVDPMKNGWYDPATNTVFINLDGPHEMGVVETILHELVHAGTESAIRNPVTDAQKRLVESLRSQMADARKAAESLIRKKLGKDVDMSNWGRLVDRARMLNDYDFFDVVYGLSSLSEFSTHATTSKAFQQFLSTVEKGGKQMGLFDRFISAIARFFTGKADFATDVYRDIVSLIGAGDKGSVRRPNYDAAAFEEYIGMPASAARGVTPEMDAEYLAAVEAGDMEKAQEMVDEAAKRAGYDFGPLWHGTRQDFQVFQRGDLGIHFGTRQQAENRGATRFVRAFLKAKPIRIPSDPGFWMGRVFMDSLVAKGYDKNTLNSIWNKAANEGGPSGFENSSADIISNGLLSLGINAIQYPNNFEGDGDSIVVLDPSQIKSADPVTRDDAGNVIPLSQRFQPESPDIRFSTARSTIENVLSLYAPALRITPEPTVTDPIFYDGVSLLTNESLMDGMDEDYIRAAAQRAAVAYNAASEDPLTSQVIQKPGFLLPSGLPDQYRRSVARGLMNAAQYASENGIYPLAFELGTEADAFGATGMMLEQELASQARGVSAEMDARYADLERRAKAGDKEAEEEAQRILDEVAKTAGYTIKGWNQGPRPIRGNVIETPFFYLTESQNPIWGEGEGYDPHDAWYLKPGKIQWPLEDVGSGAFINYKQNPLYYKDGKWTDLAYQDDVVSVYNQAIAEYEESKSLGYDTIAEPSEVDRLDDSGSFQYITFDPERLKTAAPFTYDNNGNLIPLSQRFQSESLDIRYSTARGYVRIPGEKVIIDPRRDKILSKFRGRGMLTPEAFEATLVTEQEKRAGQQAARFLANNLNKAIETAFGKGTKNTKGLRVFVIDSKGNVSFTQPFETLKKAQDFATKNGYAQYVIKSPEELINVALGNSEPSLTEKQQELLDEQEEKGITAIKNRIAIEIDKMLRTQNEYIAEAQKAGAPQSRFDEIANDKKIFQETIAQLQARLEAKLKKRREKLEEWMLNRNSRNFKDTQDEARSFLPAKVVEEIVNARDSIDGRSEEIAGIEYLMGDGMMRIIFEANNGIYVTRVYEAFESANRRNYADWLFEAYMAKVEGKTDEKGRPIKYDKLAAERIAPLVRVLTERLIDKRAKDIISDADQRMVDDVWSELVGRKFYKFIDQEAVKEGAKAELLRRRRRNKQLFISSLAQYLASDIDILLDADKMGRASGITPASTPKEMLRAAKKVAADVYNNPEDNLDLLDDSGIDYNRMLIYRLPTKNEATDTARQQYQMAEAARRKGIPDPSGVKWRTSINNEVYGSFISALNHDFTENLLFIVDAPGGKSGSSKSMEDWKKIGDQILMNRKNVPDYMRKFWGEIDNPANRVTQTIIKQSTLLANAAYRENIAKIGLAQGWAVEESEFKSDPAKYYGWRKLVSGDEGYEDNPLKDLYVHPEIYNSLEIRRSPNDPSNGAFKFIGGWVGVALWNATSGLLRGATRNLASLPNWALNSGVMLANPMEFARFWSNFGIAAKAISEHLSTVPKVEGGAEGDPKSIKIVKDSWAWMLQAYGFTGTGARVLGGAGSGLNAVSRFFGRLETKADSKAYQDLYTRAAREGIADNNIERNDMARLLNYEDDLTREPIRKNIDTFFPWGGVASKAQDAFGYIIKTGKATMGNRTEYYSSMDSMTKITLWLTEMESQAKIHAKDDAEFNKWRGEDGMFRELPAELQTKAAQNVNNTVQSDSRVAELVVQFRKSGWGKIMSPFLASRVEFIRTAANAYRIAFDEINNGVNSKEKARGFKRLLSAMTAHFVYASIATAFAVAVMRAVGGGEEDDEEGKTLNATELDGLRKMLPEWANNKVLAARVYKNGDIDWADVSFQLPFGWINEIFISASKGMDKAATDDLVAQTVAVQIVSDFIGNFSSRQIAIEAISNAMSGYDRIRNKEIWEKDDNLAVKIQKGVEYYFKSAGYPGDVRDAIKMYKAAYGVEENGSKYKMDAVLLSMATGQSIRTQKVSEMFLSEMRQAQDHYRVVNRSLYSSALRDANNVDPESVVEDTLLARRRFNEITRDLNQTFAAAVDVLKAGGMPHAKAKKMITDVMKSQEVKLSQTLERAIINNYIPKYRASEITEKKIRSLDKKYSDNRFNAYLDAIRK